MCVISARPPCATIGDHGYETGFLKYPKTDEIELAKQEAQKAREQREAMSQLTEEQLAEVAEAEQMEEKIPEYRRRALILVEEEKPKEPLSVRIKRKIYQFLKETTLEEELKKEGVSLEQFREVSSAHEGNGQAGRGRTDVQRKHHQLCGQVGEHRRCCHSHHHRRSA